MKSKQKIAIYEGFGNESKAFSEEWLKKQGASPVKHIQLYINEEPIMRIGCMYHKNLLSRTLREFNIDFRITPLPSISSQEGPLMIGDGYKMVGTGKIGFLNNGKFNFWDCSAHYHTYANPLSTNKKHLLDLGFKIIRGDSEDCYEPCFIVEFGEDKKELIKNQKKATF